MAVTPIFAVIAIAFTVIHLWMLVQLVRGYLSLRRESLKIPPRDLILFFMRFYANYRDASPGLREQIRQVDHPGLKLALRIVIDGDQSDEHHTESLENMLRSHLLQFKQLAQKAQDTIRYLPLGSLAVSITCLIWLFENLGSEDFQSILVQGSSYAFLSIIYGFLVSYVAAGPLMSAHKRILQRELLKNSVICEAVESMGHDPSFQVLTERLNSLVPESDQLKLQPVALRPGGHKGAA